MSIVLISMCTVPGRSVALHPPGRGPADDLLDGGRVREDGEQHIGLDGHLRARPGLDAARGGQFGGAASAVADDREAAFHEVAGDRQAHLAQADQSDSVHLRLLAVRCRYRQS
jgi:hypothetical protein